MFSLRWKADAILGKKEVLGLKTTLSLYKIKKSSLQDYADNLETRLAEVIATIKETIQDNKAKGMSRIGSI